MRVKELGEIKYSTSAVCLQQNPEVHDDEKMVDTLGYVPNKLRIENFLMSGHQHDAIRRGQYDFKSGEIVDDYWDHISRTRLMTETDAIDQLKERYESFRRNIRIDMQNKMVEKDNEEPKEVVEEPQGDVED